VWGEGARVIEGREGEKIKMGTKSVFRQPASLFVSLFSFAASIYLLSFWVFGGYFGLFIDFLILAEYFYFLFWF
jgi:hypothetical protein